MKREPGFYWWRQSAESRWQVVELHDDGDDAGGSVLFTGSDWHARAEDERGEWGPRLPQPVTLAPELF